MLNNPSSNSLSRKSSSVRNYRGRKYTVQADIDAQQQFEQTRINGVRTAAPVPHFGHSQYQNDVNNTVIYYDQHDTGFPRSKTNSRKRGTVMTKGKDSRNIPVNKPSSSIRPNRTSIKRTPLSYANNQTRTKSTNNRSNLKDRIKTIEYNDNGNFRSLVARSNTVNKKRKYPLQNNFGTNETSIKPYSNFIPSTNTRSNITIDRSGSLGYGKLHSGLPNPNSISNISSKKSNSRKIIGAANEYEDDSILTINPGYGKNSNLTTTLGIHEDNENDITINSYKSKVSAKDLTAQPKFTKVSKKEGLRSKSNKRTIKENFERVYMQSPCKIFNNSKPALQPRLKKNIQTHDSQGSLKDKTTNLRDNNISPSMPKVKDAVAREPRHKTSIKERKPLNFNNSMKHEVSSMATSKDHSKANILGLKNNVSHLFYLV